MHLCSSDVSGTSNRASLTILLILCTVFLRNKVVFLEISDRQSQDTTHEFTFFRHRDSHRYLIGVASRTCATSTNVCVIARLGQRKESNSGHNHQSGCCYSHTRRRESFPFKGWKWKYRDGCTRKLNSLRAVGDDKQWTVTIWSLCKSRWPMQPETRHWWPLVHIEEATDEIEWRFTISV